MHMSKIKRIFLVPPLLWVATLLAPAAIATPAAQLSCRVQSHQTGWQQLDITANALGSHDVSLVTRAGTRPPQLTWLALRLACTANTGTWHCTTSINTATSAHRHSSLRADIKGTNLQIDITSPLLPDGKASYSYEYRNCTKQTRRTTYRETISTGQCLAIFYGAHYEPDHGDCIATSVSGCRNPLPYDSLSECRRALRL